MFSLHIVFDLLIRVIYVFFLPIRRTTLDVSVDLHNVNVNNVLSKKHRSHFLDKEHMIKFY